MRQISDNPATAKLASRQGYMTMWMGDDRRLVMYPCSDNTMMNFVGIHPSELSASKGEGTSRAVRCHGPSWRPSTRPTLKAEC